MPTSNTDFSKAYNWASNSNSTGRMPVTADDDDFTSDALDGAWTINDNDGYLDSPNPYYSLTANADQLALRAKGSDVYGSANQFEAYPCWLRLVKNGTAVSAFYRTATASSWTQLGGARTPQSTAANSQIGMYTLVERKG